MESDRGKLFVGGVTRDTTEATLKAHFQKYGAVSGSAISKDPATSIPRGFGFVCFFDPSAADRALQDTHEILGRQVDVKRARPRRKFPNPRNEQRPPPSSQLSGASSFDSQFSTKKIFVGGLAASVTELEFKNYFERFGRVNDVVVMIDMATHRPRGFGFITFDSEDSVENAMQQNFHELGGKFVEVKKAVPRDEYYSNNRGRGYQPAVNHPVYASSPPPTYGVLPTPAPYNGYGGFTITDGYAGVYGGWYPSGGYAGLAYGIPPIVPQAFMFPAYGGNSFYPAYTSGGSWVTAADGYNLYNRVPGQGVNQREHTAADLKSSGDDGEKHDVDA